MFGVSEGELFFGLNHLKTEEKGAIIWKRKKEKWVPDRTEQSSGYIEKPQF